MSNLGGELMDTDESGLLKGQTVVFDDVGNEVSITATDDRAGNTVTAVTGLAQFITSIRPPAIPGAQQQVKVVRPGSVTTKFMPVKKPPAIAPAPSPAASGLVTKAVIMTSSGQQLVISSPVKSGVDHNQKSNTITLGPATGNVVNQGPQQIMLFSPIKQSTGKLVQVRPKPPSTSWTPIEMQSVSQRKNGKPLQIIRLVQTSNSLTHTAQTSGTTKAYTINRMPTMPISSNFSRAQTSTVSSSGSVATTQKILIPASAIKSSPSTGMIQSSSNTMQQAFITNSGGGQVIMLPAHMFQGQGGQSTASSLPSSATQRTSFVPIAPSPLGSQPTIPASQMLAGLNGSKAAQNSIKSEGDANRPRKPCNCTISQCLKLYCDCFAAFSNLLGFTFCDERTKTWSAGIRYSDTKLWSLKRLPCSKDRVIFPNNTAIYIDRPIKAREVILPLNGELNLDEKVGFGLLDKSNDESGSCQGNDMYFIVQEKDWYDPYNWVTTIDHIKFDGASIWNPIPHSDRIPCPFDDVHFPSGFTFRTKLPLVSRTYIKSLTINNKAYDTDLFARFTETQTGKYLFKSFPNKNQLVIDKARGQCSDKTGCSCGNGEDPKVLAQICAHLSASASCPPLVCQDPVTPSGHCCPVCASLIKVTFDPKEFKYLLSENILKTYQAKTSFVDTFAYMSKRGKNQVEIVITDSGQASSGKGNEFAKSLYEYIQEDMKPNSPGIYAIKTISLVSTVRWTSDGSGHSSLLGTLLFLLFLLFLITLLLISASIAVYLYRTDQLPSGAFTFVRFHGFDADDDKVELHLGTRSNYELDSELVGGVSDSGGVQLRSEGNESSVTLSTFTIDEEKISFDNPYFKCGPDNEFSRDLVRECRSLTSVDTIDTMTNKSFTEEEEGNQKLDSVSTRLLLLDE